MGKSPSVPQKGNCSLCVFCHSPCSLQPRRLRGCSVSRTAYSNIKKIALGVGSPWNTLPPETCVVDNLPSSRSLFKYHLLGDTLLKKAPLSYIPFPGFLFLPSLYPYLTGYVGLRLQVNLSTKFITV